MHNDSVVIVDEYGREIRIKVTLGEHDTKKTIKLNFEAPKEFDIYRGELYDQSQSDDSNTNNGNNSK